MEETSGFFVTILLSPKKNVPRKCTIYLDTAWQLINNNYNNYYFVFVLIILTSYRLNFG